MNWLIFVRDKVQKFLNKIPKKRQVENKINSFAF